MSTGAVRRFLETPVVLLPFPCAQTTLLLRSGCSELQARRWLFTCHNATSKPLIYYVRLMRLQPAH